MKLNFSIIIILLSNKRILNSIVLKKVLDHITYLNLHK